MEDLINDVALSLGVFPLKPEQSKAVLAFLEGKDVFVALPTGYGKSIIYAMLPAVFDRLKGIKCYIMSCNLWRYMFAGVSGSIVVCISPLTTIMMDQKAKFERMGIKAEFVGETQDSQGVVAEVIAGRIQLLFISPESILNNKLFRGMLVSDQYKDKLVAVVVDEAHCVKTWYVIGLKL